MEVNVKTVEVDGISLKVETVSGYKKNVYLPEIKKPLEIKSYSKGWRVTGNESIGEHKITGSPTIYEVIVENLVKRKSKKKKIEKNSTPKTKTKTEKKTKKAVVFSPASNWKILHKEQGCPGCKFADKKKLFKGHCCKRKEEPPTYPDGSCTNRREDRKGKFAERKEAIEKIHEYIVSNLSNKLKKRDFEISKCNTYRSYKIRGKRILALTNSGKLYFSGKLYKSNSSEHNKLFNLSYELYKVISIEIPKGTNCHFYTEEEIKKWRMGTVTLMIQGDLEFCFEVAKAFVEIRIEELVG